MSEHIKMTAALRDRAGKGNARATRRQGKVPAVIYGDNKPPVLISIDNLPVIKALHGGTLFTHLCDLDVDGQKHLVLARDVQLHPVKDTPNHVDFLRVSEKTVITVEVPLHIVGDDKCPGVRAGGVLNFVVHNLEVSCRADQIPEGINVDVSKLQAGESLKIADLTLPKNVKATADEATTLVSITAPSDENDDSAEGSVEVEVTNQKAADEEAK